eukprot:7380030-Prymnesium_polylepis.1
MQDVMPIAGWQFFSIWNGHHGGKLCLLKSQVVLKHTGPELGAFGRGCTAARWPPSDIPLLAGHPLMCDNGVWLWGGGVGGNL